MYVQKFRVSLCNATVLWCLDQQPTLQTDEQTRQKPARKTRETSLSFQQKEKGDKK